MSLSPMRDAINAMFDREILNAKRAYVEARWRKPPADFNIADQAEKRHRMLVKSSKNFNSGDNQLDIESAMCLQEMVHLAIHAEACANEAQQDGAADRNGKVT
jgi:hypothetical protein